MNRVPLSSNASGLSRREFLQRASAGAVAAWSAGCASMTRDAGATRRFSVCLGPDAIARDPELIPTIQAAGIRTIWMGGFFYGHWPYPVEQLEATRRRLEQAGLEAQIVNVPLGHPGDSLGSTDGQFPLTPPRTWRLAQRPDGTTYAGTSHHAPATAENVAALRRLREAGFSRFFVDDDFRLARGPGEIGGCFCPEHQRRFCQRTGYSPTQWQEMLEDIRARRLSARVRAWIEFNCDELTASFRAQEAVVGRGRLGPMVMYLGAEKAGIRLRDYRDRPFRVGELMFDDNSFGKPKGKTDELFSVLFHRRFVPPELACSESTAYPADRLSAPNLAAKLVISTIADVRHTMFMSGVTPFPRAHWATLGPAMREQAGLHARLAGHRPAGPFKHFWGERSRWVGTDRPFSLFLATGVPFAVTETPAPDGWTFIADDDVEGLELPAGVDPARLVCRPSAPNPPTAATLVEESLPALFALKSRLRPQLAEIPTVIEDEPVVLAWYPTAHAVLLWNLLPEPRRVTVARGWFRQTADLPPLGARLLDGW